MKNLSEYEIQFSGLKEGVHQFNFSINKAFFEYFEYPDFHDVDLNVSLQLDRQSTHMVLNFSVDGSVTMACVRCLDDFQLNMSFTESLVIKFGEEISDSRYIGEEIERVTMHDHEINVARFIYEFALLHVPVKPVHNDSEDGSAGCNPEMIEKLEGYSGQELNADEESDPRWDRLKDLLNN